MRRPPALVALLALLALLGARRAVAAERCERVVLVVLGGGVRAKEMLDRPDLMPTIKKIGAAGFVSRGWKAGGVDHPAAFEAIVTGRTPAQTGRGPTSAPPYPTVLEYARKGLALEAGQAWFVSYADEDAAVAHSEHADYGEDVGPSTAFGEGPFARSLRPLFELFGRPNATSDRAAALLAGLRGTSLQAAPAAVRATAGAGSEGAEVESVLLEEVDRRAATSGANALDARALRAALTVLRLHRPRLLVVRLGQADVAHRDLFQHWEVLKRNDAAIARLRDGIAADPALAGTTLLVTADLGRNTAQNAAGGYDHDDGGEDATTVGVVGEGPGLKKGASLRAPLDVRDLAPTIGRLLGFPTPLCEGKPREDLVP